MSLSKKSKSSPLRASSRITIKPPTQYTTPGGIGFRGCDIVDTVQISGAGIHLGDELVFMPVSPLEMGARIKIESMLYDNYRVKSYRLHYVPVCAKTTSGQLVIYYDADLEDRDTAAFLTGIPAIQEASAHIYNVSSAVCDQTTLEVKPSCFAKELFCHSTSSITSTQGFVRILWAGGDVDSELMLGLLYVEYDVEFMNPNLSVYDVVPVGGTVNVTPVAGMPFSTPEWYPLDNAPLFYPVLERLGYPVSDVPFYGGTTKKGFKFDITTMPKVEFMLSLAHDLLCIENTAALTSIDRYFSVYVYPAAAREAVYYTLGSSSQRLLPGFITEGWRVFSSYVRGASIGTICNDAEVTMGFEVTPTYRDMQDLAAGYSVDLSIDETTLLNGDWYAVPVIYHKSNNGDKFSWSLESIIAYGVVTLVPWLYKSTFAKDPTLSSRDRPAALPVECPICPSYTQDDSTTSSTTDIRMVKGTGSMAGPSLGLPKLSVCTHR